MILRAFLSAALIVLVIVRPAVGQAVDADAEGTYSIVGRDSATGELGMGVQSKAFATGTRTITIKGGLAVIAHQASSNPMYGALGLELLGRGMTPQQALDIIVRGDEGRDSRQVAMLDAQGRTAAWTGSGPNDWKGHACGTNYCAQGNILMGPEVVAAMAKSFESSSGPLAERLLAALDAAQAAGGDARGMQAAAVVVARPLGGAAGFSDRIVDLRVDDHRAPLAELRRLLNMLRAGQMLGDANRKLTAGDAPGALEIATKARDLSPENDSAWVALAGIYLKIDRRREALDAVRKAIELNPANKRQLPKNKNLAPLWKDAEFLKLVT